MRDAGWADEDDGLIAMGVGVEGGIGGGGVMLINQIRSGQGSHSFHSLPETAREGGRRWEIRLPRSRRIVPGTHDGLSMFHFHTPYTR